MTPNLGNATKKNEKKTTKNDQGKRQTNDKDATEKVTRVLAKWSFWTFQVGSGSEYCRMLPNIKVATRLETWSLCFFCGLIAGEHFSARARFATLGHISFSTFRKWQSLGSPRWPPWGETCCSTGTVGNWQPFSISQLTNRPETIY